MENPRELIDEIKRFIRSEREMYGDFSMSGGADDLGGDETEGKPEERERQGGKKRGTGDSSAPGVTRSGSTGATRRRTSSPASGLDPQEGLFEEEGNRDVYYRIGECRNLRELEELCRSAEVLRTDLEETNLVFGVGDPEADLMLIGEAPGAEEDRQGEPFVGAAGMLLNKILAAIDFEREEVYIANILKHRPPNNRDPKPEERARSLPFLMRQIELIDPRLILCLGRTAAQTLLDTDASLSSMRETFHRFRGKYELMATYHPAALLRHEKWKRPTWEDVQLLRERYDQLTGDGD